MRDKFRINRQNLRLVHIPLYSDSILQHSICFIIVVIVVTITVIIRNIIGLHTTIFCFYLATIKALSTFSQCASVGFITALLIRIHRVDVASVALAI